MSTVSSVLKRVGTGKTHAENSDRTPPERLIDDGANVREILEVLEGRKAVGSNDLVELGLSFGDEGRAELGAREHERDEGTGGGVYSCSKWSAAGVCDLERRGGVSRALN
jgi:hypothetical protein